MLDALRLSKGMTYKSSLAGLNFGGGKFTVMAEKSTREIMLKVGEAVNYLNGLYITAEDVGTNLSDIFIAREVTPYTAKLDGSSMTALGVKVCMDAAIKYQNKWDISDMSKPIWIQGLGKVGMDLAHRLQGTTLLVSDLRKEAVLQSMSVGARELTEYDHPFIEIYAPCAMGQVINSGNINNIKYSIICGSANNQLLDDSYADVLKQKGIIYCPDYLVNAGGVINAAYEFDEPFDSHKCENAVNSLGNKLLEVFEMSDKENISPLSAANILAEERFKPTP